MADQIDIAQDITDVYLDNARRRAIGKSGPEFDARFDGAHCVECEDDIPPARLELGKVRCVECQAAREPKPAYKR